MQAFAQAQTHSDTENRQQASTASGGDVAQIDISPRGIVEKIDSWADGFVQLLPNIAVAAVMLAAFWLLSLAASRLVIRWAATHERDNLGRLLGSLAKTVVLVAGALLALTVVVPSVRPGDLIAGLGIGSVAIGFAFKDILQNWLAGLLILLRRPFSAGDQIAVEDHEGTVDTIDTRVTVIKTYDGRQVLVPNSTVYTNAVVVNTAYEKRRSQYDVGIGYGDDLAKAKSAIIEAVNAIEGVETEPAAEVLVQDLAASWVTLRVRWWTHTTDTNLVHVKSRVIEAIKLKLDEAGIDMPFETVVELFHDQTEETDGKRGKQREGWPAGKGKPPRSRLDVRLDAEAEKTSR